MSPLAKVLLVVATVSAAAAAARVPTVASATGQAGVDIGGNASRHSLDGAGQGGATAADSVALSTVFQSHMVLQRGRPIRVWGFGAASLGKQQRKAVARGAAPAIAVTLGQESRQATVQGDRFEATFAPRPASAAGVRLAVSVGGAAVQTLDDVVVGDVFLFSGQSNIDIPEQYGHQFDEAAQAAEEAAADALDGLTRIMIVPNQVRGIRYNSTPARELATVPDARLCGPAFVGGAYVNCQDNAMRWVRANGTTIRGFSATGWFTGTALRKLPGAVDGVPLGLVRSSWGGTQIQAWTPAGAVPQCPDHGTAATSALFDWMIYPFAGLELSAVVWYQGESNTGPNGGGLGPVYYGCALPAMISAWRAAMGAPGLPFLVVELAAYCNEHDSHTFHTWCDQNTTALNGTDYHLPAMRLAQAKAEALPNVHVVTAIDLGSLHPRDGSIHSDKKIELGARLALAAAVAVYNQTGVVFRGPAAARAAADPSGGPGAVRVRFSVLPGAGGLALNASAACPPPVLHVYCTGAGFELQGGDSVWRLAGNVAVAADDPASVVVTPPTAAARSDGSVATRVRYAYADWPVVSVRNAGGDRLPARPFDVPVAGGV